MHLTRGRWYEWRSSDSALGNFISNYIPTTQNFRQKIKFHHFWWVVPENSINHFTTQKLVKNQEPDGYYEIELKMKYRLRASVWLSEQNYKRIKKINQGKSFTGASIFSSSRILKFFKKRLILSDASIKLLPPAKIIMSVTLFYQGDSTLQILLRWVIYLPPLKKPHLNKFLACSSTMVKYTNTPLRAT